MGSLALYLHAFFRGVPFHRSIKDIDFYLFWPVEGLLKKNDLIGKLHYLTAQGELRTDYSGGSEVARLGIDMFTNGYLGVEPKESDVTTFVLKGTPINVTSIEYIRSVKLFSANWPLREQDYLDIEYIDKNFTLDPTRMQEYFQESQYVGLPAAFPYSMPNYTIEQFQKAASATILKRYRSLEEYIKISDLPDDILKWVLNWTPERLEQDARALRASCSAPVRSPYISKPVTELAWCIIRNSARAHDADSCLAAVNSRAKTDVEALWHASYLAQMMAFVTPLQAISASTGFSRPRHYLEWLSGLESSAGRV